MITGRVYAEAGTTIGSATAYGNAVFGNALLTVENHGTYIAFTAQDCVEDICERSHNIQYTKG